MKSRYQLYSLKREAKDLERKNDQAKTALEELNNNKSSLEKFARETYYMKKDNEEVFVFKERND